MNLVAEAKMDKSVFEVDVLENQGNERNYWWSKTPAERMQALELMRQIIYGYDPATTRLQRILEVAQLK